MHTPSIPDARPVSFDQNVVDHLLDAGVAAREVAGAMAARGIELMVSEYNMQEWALCWRDRRPETEQRGQALIGYALDLTSASDSPPGPAPAPGGDHREAREPRPTVSRSRPDVPLHQRCFELPTLQRA